MGTTLTTPASATSGVVNIAQLISSLAPIFAGSGTTTGTTGAQASTSTTTSKSSIDPATLAMLNSIITTAGGNASNPAATKGIVDNILAESSQAFAPVIASGNSAGLYGTSTLANLASESKARATAAASKAVLDYTTSQQSIQLNALNTVASGNKSTTSTTGTNVAPTFSTKITAPSINPLTSIATIGGGVLANKLLGSSPVSSALDTAGSAINAHVIAPITDALGITTNATPLAAQASLLSGAGGNTFGVGALSGGVGATAPGLSAEGVAGLAAPATNGFTGLGAGTAELAAEQGGSLLTFGTEVAPAIAGELGGATIGAGGEIAGGALVGEAAGAAGLEAAGGLGAAELLAAGPEIAGITGGLGGAAIGAEAGAFGAEAFATSVGAEAVGGAEAALAGSSFFAEAGAFIESALEVIGSIIAWIICTELLHQGKMSPTLYRYGQKKFINYPEYIKYGYLLWARPIRNYIRKYPDSKITAFVAKFFDLRVNNIAYRMGCSRAVWTIRGACICGFTYSVTAVIGVLLLPIRGNLLKSYFRSVQVGV